MIHSFGKAGLKQSISSGGWQKHGYLARRFAWLVAGWKPAISLCAIKIKTRPG